MVRWGNEDNIAIGDDDVALDYLLEGRTRKEMRTKLDQAKIILATLNAFGGLNFGEEVQWGSWNNSLNWRKVFKCLNFI